MCESQEPPSPFKSTFTRIILSLLTGAYNSQQLYHNMTEHLWDRKFKYNYIYVSQFSISKKRYTFSKLPLILYPTCLCLGSDYFYIVKDEYPIIHFVSISKRSIEPLFLSRYVVPQRLRLPIYSIKNNTSWHPVI